MKEKANMDVRQFLQRNGLTQQDVADYLGVTRACICTWLRHELPFTKKAQLYNTAMKVYEMKYGNQLIS